MTILVNLGSGGTDGVAVTTGNSGGTGSDAFDVVDDQSNTSVDWEADNRWPGANLGILFQVNTGAGQPAFVSWTTSLFGAGTNASQVNVGCSLYVSALPSITGTSTTVALLRGLQSGNQRWRVGLRGDGKIRLTGNAEAEFGVSTLTVATGTMYFIEVGAAGSAANGAMELRIYDDSGSLIETMGPYTSIDTGGPVNQIRFGVSASLNPSALTGVYLSHFQASDEGWMGPPGFATPAVAVGPMSGGVTSTSAQAVWTLDNADDLDCRIVASTDPDLDVSPIYSATSSPDADGVFKASLTGLAADTAYHYGVEIDGVLQENGRGVFRTFPTEGSVGSFVVAFGSCQIANQDSDTFDLIRTYEDPIDGLTPLALIHHGDYGYPDWETAVGAAVVRAHYEQQLALPKLSALHAAIPWSYTPNNHDLAADPCDKNSPSVPSVAAGYRQYIPSYDLPAADDIGFFHSFVINRVRFIVLDVRSQRDPATDTDNSSKSMLGADQLAWLEMELQAPEPLKVIVSDPWRAAGAGSGRWGAYTYEFGIINDMIDQYADGRVIIASGDRHALAADDGSADNTRGRPNVVGAPFNQGSTQDFEDWSHGYFYSYQDPPIEQNVDAAGFMKFIDNGNEIVFTYRGLTSDGVERVTMSLTFDISATVDLTPASIALDAVAVSPTPGAVSLTLTPATVTASAVATSADPGEVTVTLTHAASTTSATTLSPAPGAVSITLQHAVTATAAIPLDAEPDAVETSLTPASVTLYAVAMSAGSIGAADVVAADLTVTAMSFTVTPGVVTVSLTAAALTMTAQSTDASPATSNVTLTVATVTTSSVAVAATPQPVSINITVPQATITAVPLIVGSAVGEVDLTPAQVAIASTGVRALLPGVDIMTVAFVTVTGAGEFIRSELTSTEGGVPNRFAHIVPGQIAWDDCDCGMFAQSITSVASSQTFPTPASDVPVNGCGHPLAVVSVTVTLVRCIPGLDNNGNSPSVQQMIASARVMEEDRRALRCALGAYLKGLFDTYKIHGYTIGAATTVGPEGQCGGIEMSYSFGVNNDAVMC